MIISFREVKNLILETITIYNKMNIIYKYSKYKEKYIYELLAF
tara:strand:- start:251 stop:379 length:129 start_codon:yes stop_codon:yes gene_type:complete